MHPWNCILRYWFRSRLAIGGEMEINLGNAPFDKGLRAQSVTAGIYQWDMRIVGDAAEWRDIVGTMPPVDGPPKCWRDDTMIIDQSLPGRWYIFLGNLVPLNALPSGAKED